MGGAMVGAGREFLTYSTGSYVPGREYQAWTPEEKRGVERRGE